MARKHWIFLLKLLLTVPVAATLAHPFLWGEGQGGMLSELVLLGPVGATVFAAFFLLLVFLYCRDLERCLTLIRPENRTARPRSVWLMFVLPYNFIEDFFIVSNLSASLRAEARDNPALAGGGMTGLWSGIGWCAAQIVSLVPGMIGMMAGLVAVPLWLWHWRFVRRMNSKFSATHTAG